MISFKSDVERLNEWMHKRNLSKKQMAHDMRLSYINVYHTMVVRGEETGRIAGNFIVRALGVSTDFLMGLTGTPDQKPEMDLAIAEIVAIAKTLSEFRQRDLLLVAQAYQDADDPTPEMMQKILEIVGEVAGEDVREKLVASLASLRPPPDDTR